MMMDQSVFGHTHFIVKDKTLFPGQPRDSDITLLHIRLRTAAAPAGGRTTADMECLVIDYCGSPWFSGCNDANGCDYENCVSDPDVCGSLELCWEVETGGGDTGGGTSGGGGGGSTGGGGGGGGTGGGGPTMPECVAPADSPEPNECTAGWEPAIRIPFYGIESISNGFTNPCIVAAKNKLPNTGLNVFANVLYFEAISQTYNWKIVFEENRNLVIGTDPIPAESFGVNATKEWHVVLNPLFWEQATQPNATQEIAGLNILHEIVHGFIYVYKDHFGLTVLNNVNTHEVIFKNFVNAMSTMLQNSFNISANDAKALALQGLDDVLEKQYSAAGTLLTYKADYNQFAITNYSISLSDAEIVFDQYVAGTKGTRCF